MQHYKVKFLVMQKGYYQKVFFEIKSLRKFFIKIVLKTFVSRKIIFLKIFFIKF